MSILLIPIAGFLGSFHCAAMCGPFVVYAGTGADAEPGRVMLAYQSGRLVAYLTLGALAGFLGQGILFAGAVVNAQRMVLVVLGLLLIAAGLAHYLPQRFRERAVSGGRRRLNRILFRLTGSGGGVEVAGLIGLLSALLPCGYLYGFVLLALAAGHPLAGLLTMAAFWLGTLPSLLGVGLATRYCSRRFLTRMSRLTPVILIVFGLLAIFGKAGALLGATSAHCMGL